MWIVDFSLFLFAVIVYFIFIFPIFILDLALLFCLLILSWFNYLSTYLFIILSTLSILLLFSLSLYHYLFSFYHLFVYLYVILTYFVIPVRPFSFKTRSQTFGNFMSSSSCPLHHFHLPKSLKSTSPLVATHFLTFKLSLDWLFIYVFLFVSFLFIY